MNFYIRIIVLVTCLILHFAYAKKTYSEKSTPADDLVEEAQDYCEDLTGASRSKASRVIMDSENTAGIQQKLKCYWECFFKKIGYMDDDGNIREKPIYLKPTPSYIKYGFSCLNVTGSDNCDKAANFLKCFRKSEREQYDGSFEE